MCCVHTVYSACILYTSVCESVMYCFYPTTQKSLYLKTDPPPQPTSVLLSLRIICKKKKSKTKQKGCHLPHTWPGQARSCPNTIGGYYTLLLLLCFFIPEKNGREFQTCVTLYSTTFNVLCEINLFSITAVLHILVTFKLMLHFLSTVQSFSGAL